jgi:YVTN family beta-propeller protein
VWVIDGATNTTSTVPVGTNPTAVAVNTATNKVYVANQGSNSLTVIDGATNGTATVSVGTQPVAVAVDEVTNKIFVANFGSGNVTVVDGATNATTTVTVEAPADVAVNPVTGKVYVTGQSNSVARLTVIDEATLATTTIPLGGSSASFVAVNPATNRVYAVVNGYSVSVIDGASNSVVATISAAPSFLGRMVVNPTTNKVYLTWNPGGLYVIDGATNAATQVAYGDHNQDLAVNPVTNKIYVARGSALFEGHVMVVDGASNTVTADVRIGPERSFRIAVNPVSNKVVITNTSNDAATVFNDVVIVDGATNTAASAGVPGATERGAVALNPTTNRAYIVNPSAATVTVLTDAPPPAGPLSTTIAALPGGMTGRSSTTFTFTATSGFTPQTPPIRAVYFRVDDWQGPWQRASPAGATFTGTVAGLAPGVHTLYAFATDAQDATQCLHGGCGPLIGGVAARVFTVVGVNRYRLYHPGTLEHLYTTDLNEAAVLPSFGWLAEGLAHSVLAAPTRYQGVPPVPLYRLYHPGIKQHLWTTSSTEYTALGSQGWIQEGIDRYALSAAVPGETLPLYRLAYPSPLLHLWTTDRLEYDTLPGSGWLQEGVVAHVFP